MEFLSGFIFDIDGTLLDSNDAHARALQRAFHEAGYLFTFEQLRPLIGMGLDHIVPKLTSLAQDSELGKKISHLKDSYFAEEFDSLQPFPQSKELVSALYVRGYLITVATSASGADLKKMIQKLGIGNYLVATASAEDTVSKPAPDLIKRALTQLDLPADEVLMVGDTPYDVAAAKQAGVRTIALRCGGWKDEAFRDALAIYNDPAALLAKLRADWKPDEVFNPRSA